MKLIEKVAKVLQSRITQEDIKIHQLNECCKTCLLCKGKRWVKKKYTKQFKSAF